MTTAGREMDAQGVDDEISYWRSIFSKYKDKEHPYIDTLASTSMPLQPEIEAVLSSYLTMRSRVKVLDVGCGPLSVLGKTGAFELDITGCDPLAENYIALMSEFGVTPPHRLIKGMAENLDQLISPESFDFVFSRNALDHCQDPASAIMNMVKAVKPYGKAFIAVCQNEAENAAYSGLHQWNFDELAGRIVIWRPGLIYFLDSVLSGLPYRYHRSHCADGKKFTDQFDIVIHKNNADVNQKTEIGPGALASFSNRHGWLTIQAMPGVLDPANSVFVHGYRAGERLLNQPMRWYSSQPCVSVSLPNGPYDYLIIGQYYVDRSGKLERYVNVWSAELRSID